MHRNLTHLQRSNFTQVAERHVLITGPVAGSCHSSELEGCTKAENWQNKQQELEPSEHVYIPTSEKKAQHMKLELLLTHNFWNSFGGRGLKVGTFLFLLGTRNTGMSRNYRVKAF